MSPLQVEPLSMLYMQTVDTFLPGSAGIESCYPDAMDIATVDIRDYPRDEFDRLSTIQDKAVEAVEDDDAHPTPIDRVCDGAPVQQRHRWTRQFEVAVKSIGVIAFLLSCVALWPAVTSASDTKMATRLAKWTSLKDFLEFCESHDFNSSGCVAARNVTLSPPPGFSNSIFRRWFAPGQKITLPMPTDVQFNAQKTSYLALIWGLYPALGLLVVLRYLERRYPQYRSTISHWLAPIVHKLTRLRGKDIGKSNSDHRCGSHSLVACNISQDSITRPHFGSIPEVFGQGTGARFIRTGNNNGSRRRNILKNRHNYHHSSRKGNHVLEEMDDSSSDELFYPLQSGVSGESRRSSRVRLRRRSGGKQAHFDAGGS